MWNKLFGKSKIDKVVSVVGLLLLVFIFFLILSWFVLPRLGTFDFNDIMETSYPIEMPINSLREAVEYAKIKMPFDQKLIDDMEEAERVDDWVEGWKIKTSRTSFPGLDRLFSNIFGKNWAVGITNRGKYIVPCYRGSIYFDSEGNIIKKYNFHRGK